MAGFAASTAPITGPTSPPARSPSETDRLQARSEAARAPQYRHSSVAGSELARQGAAQPSASSHRASASGPVAAKPANQQPRASLCNTAGAFGASSAASV